jgi:hypothetical protein
MSVTPPGRKSKDHDAINLDDDIAPGGVSFHHSFQSDLGEHHAFPILQYVVGSFHEMEAVGIPSHPRGLQRDQSQDDDDQDWAGRVPAWSFAGSRQIMDIQAMTSAATKSASPAMMTNHSATIAKRT